MLPGIASDALFVIATKAKGSSPEPNTCRPPGFGGSMCSLPLTCCVGRNLSRHCGFGLPRVAHHMGRRTACGSSTKAKVAANNGFVSLHWHVWAIKPRSFMERHIKTHEIWLFVECCHVPLSFAWKNHSQSKLVESWRSSGGGLVYFLLFATSEDWGS